MWILEREWRALWLTIYSLQGWRSNVNPWARVENCQGHYLQSSREIIRIFEREWKRIRLTISCSVPGELWIDENCWARVAAVKLFILQWFLYVFRFCENEMLYHCLCSGLFEHSMWKNVSGESANSFSTYGSRELMMRIEMSNADHPLLSP